MADITCGEDRIALLTGKLTADSVIELKDKGERLLDSFAGSIVIDLSEVSYASSAGIALLLSWQRTAAALGKPVRYINVPRCLSGMITVSGLQTILSTADNKHESTACTEGA